ncbi:MAG: hypothetical protein Q4G27_04605 [Flavobacteriaceae bacterium]|nr:hypothetical protein [Flavobacteriaceae bacterium]
MKYIVIFCALISLFLILTGVYFYIQDNLIYNKLFGFGTIGLFFITFPLFLFWRRNKFDRNKYIWNNEERENLKQNKKTEERNSGF